MIKSTGGKNEKNKKGNFNIVRVNNDAVFVYGM